MENNTFRLMVLAIVAVALIGIFIYQFSDFFKMKKNAEDEVKKKLDEAETDLGHFKSKIGSFEQEHTIQAMAFESTNRSIVFECNSELFCCAEGEKCEKSIEWDNAGNTRYFSFNDSKTIIVSGRCRHEEIYICRVYLGEEPAQVNIKEITFENEEFDLSENTKFSIGFETENVGQQDMFSTKAKAMVYKIISRHGTETERKLVDEFSVDFPLGAGEEHSDEIELEITENGEYEIEVIIEEEDDETNYEKQVFELNAFGEADSSTCTAGELKIQELEKCVYLLPCKCKSIVECERIWREALDLSIEDKFEVMSADEKKEEITLKYEAEYNIPDFCDPEEMDCEGYCVEPPEPDCRTKPCKDSQNCRVWLPCECDVGADFSKCEAVWKEQLPERTLQTGQFNGETTLFVSGEIKRIPHEICGPCGGIVKSWIDCCELPKVLNCGGKLCEGSEPEVPEPEPEPVIEPPICEDGAAQTLNCIQNDLDCDLLFVCECMSFEQCKQAWITKLETEWGFPGASTQFQRAIPGNYPGKTAVKLEGEDKTDCTECLPDMRKCHQDIWGLETRCKQIP